MTEDQKAEISRIQHCEAEWIRNRGLGIDWFSDRQTPKVHESSWEPLAQINEAGILTYGSQDAIDSETGEVKDYERSYIQACMTPGEETSKIIERFNLWSDSMFAFACVKVSEAQFYKNRDAPSTAVSLRYDKKRGGWFASMTLRSLINTDWEKEMQWLFGMTKKMPIMAVNFVDAKWGRPSTASDGLFNALLQAADSTVAYPRRLRHPPPIGQQRQFSAEVIAEHRAKFSGPPSSRCIVKE